VVSITVQTAGEQVEGSGVILASDGLVVTNNHVVEDAAGGGRITVRLSDGRTVLAHGQRRQAGRRVGAPVAERQPQGPGDQRLRPADLV
jgi:S1-C subfamily serine protease